MRINTDCEKRSNDWSIDSEMSHEPSASAGAELGLKGKVFCPLYNQTLKYVWKAHLEEFDGLASFALQL